MVPQSVLELVVLGAPPDSFSKPWPVDTATDVRVTELAFAQLDTVIRETRATRIEQAWCVADFLVEFVHGRRVITLGRLERSSRVARADSLHIWSGGRGLCESESVPGLHSHLVWANGWLYFPSDVDLETARSGDAQFSLLISAGDGRVPRLTVYALQ